VRVVRFAEFRAEGRIGAERLLYHDSAKAADAFIHCRVPVATKAAFGVIARHQGITDSALLRRMIDLSLQSAGVDGPYTPAQRRQAQSFITALMKILGASKAAAGRWLLRVRSEKS
jgi:hypothetical protein